MIEHQNINADRYGRYGEAATVVARIKAGLPAYEPPRRQSSQPAPIAARTKSAKPKTRIQIVAHAVETDPKCKGKAHLALAMLADDDLAGVTGPGIVKLLARTPVPKNEDEARAQARAFRSPAAGNASKGANHCWDTIIAEMQERRH